MRYSSKEKCKRILRVCLACLGLCVIGNIAAARQASRCWFSSPTVFVMQGSQAGQGGGTQRRQLYSIEVVDADEAALLEQQIKLKPELLRGRSFYYYGDEALNRRLRELGYQPVKEDADVVFTRVVRILRKGEEKALREMGALVLLREPKYWVVRVNHHQSRALKRLGYRVEEIRREEARPRLIRVTAPSREAVAQIVAPLVDIDHVEQSRDGYVVQGGAFDNAIDELRAKGLKVEIIANRR
jgi:hypothetical protein